MHDYDMNNPKTARDIMYYDNAGLSPTSDTDSGVADNDGAPKLRKIQQTVDKAPVCSTFRSDAVGPKRSTPADVAIIVSPASPSRIKKNVGFLDYDKLFENPSQFRVESFDEGVECLENDPVMPSTPDDILGDRKLSITSSKLSRGDSVMEQGFADMLRKNLNSSQGFYGFRRRVANDINHKYCSYCRCDDVLFLFLYVLFGISYICAGVFGLLNCQDENLINYYLIIDGVLSIFIFPVTIMEWTKRIGGCLRDDEKLDSGVYFYIITCVRLVVVSLGTVLLVLRVEALQKDLMCVIVYMLLKVGVIMEWTFVFLGIFLPQCVYVIMYWVTKAYL